jgi:hypothetical protein
MERAVFMRPACGMGAGRGDAHAGILMLVEDLRQRYGFKYLRRSGGRWLFLNFAHYHVFRQRPEIR